MIVTLIVVSFICGIAFTIVCEILWLRRKFGQLPKQPIIHRSQYDRFRLPRELKLQIRDPDLKTKKESCLFLNLIFHFLFKELKDTKKVRSYVVKKMNFEFVELMRTTSGKLIDQISVREFNLGNTFPVINSASVKHIEVEEEAIEELDLSLDIDYRGGLFLALDVDLVFGKSAHLSVRLVHLKGVARLQLTRKPYTHWSFSFFEEPHIEFEVESRFEGRPIPQITSLIVNQIKRTIRKKHTLPNYKMRFRPFFIQPEPFKMKRDIYIHGNRLGEGELEVTVMECNRLVQLSTHSHLYCTLSVDNLPWTDLVIARRSLWISIDVEIVKGQSTNIGITFKEEFVLDRYEDVVVIDVVTTDTPASLVDIRKDDVIVSVSGIKVTSSKQAARLIKSAGDRISVRLERPRYRDPKLSELKSVDSGVLLLKDSDKEYEIDTDDMDDDSSEFVNVSIKTCDIAPEKSSPKRISFLGSPGKLFQRQRAKISAGADASSSSSASNSPEVSKKLYPLINKIEDSPKVSPIKKPVFITDSPRTSRSQSDTASVQSKDLDRKDSGNSLNKDMVDDEITEKPDIRRTTEVPSRQSPIWNEAFKFDVLEKHRYVNICVWCRLPEKLDKQNKVVKPEKEILLGHASLSITDISLGCLMTMQGETQDTVYLTPPETKGGSSRKMPNIASHPGFEPNLCHGDVTLGFSYIPNKMSDEDRKQMTKSLPEASAIDLAELTLTEEHAGSIQKQLEEGMHDFVGTQFNTATYCNFCGKKIWLKVAFQCGFCSMICHKKCTDKCQAQTICSKDGPKMKSSPNKLWRPPVTQSSDLDKRKSKELSQKSGGLLSKFRKESSQNKPCQTSHDGQLGVSDAGIQIKVSPAASPRTTPPPSPNSSPPPSPSHSPHLSPGRMRTKRNSLPNETSLGEAASSMTAHSMPHTRSTTALQSLVNSDVSPVLQPDELNYKEYGYETDSSDTDSEMQSSDSFRAIKRQTTPSQSLDEIVVMEAKEKGRELFADLSLEDRKKKLDEMVTKLQFEIDQESENRTELQAVIERKDIDSSQRQTVKIKIDKSEEKMEALMLMLLHYCAGLQHCLDQEEEERQKCQSNEDLFDSSVSIGDKSEL